MFTIVFFCMSYVRKIMNYHFSPFLKRLCAHSMETYFVINIDSNSYWLEKLEIYFVVLLISNGDVPIVCSP